MGRSAQLAFALMPGVSYRPHPRQRLETTDAQCMLPDGTAARAAWTLIAGGPTSMADIQYVVAAVDGSALDLATISAVLEGGTHAGWLCHMVIQGDSTLARLQLGGRPVVEPAQADLSLQWCLSPLASLRAEAGKLVAENPKLAHQLDIEDPLLASLLAGLASVHRIPQRGSAAHFLRLAIAAGILVTAETAWREAAAIQRGTELPYAPAVDRSPVATPPRPPMTQMSRPTVNFSGSSDYSTHVSHISPSVLEMSRSLGGTAPEYWVTDSLMAASND